MQSLAGLARWVLPFLMGLTIWPSAVAELVFSAPPRESQQVGEEIYAPLTDYLADLLGQPVVYQHPYNWLAYQRDMRAGRYDLVFDGPHLVAWRIAHIDHQPLVRLPSPLKFHVITLAQREDINELDDLIGKRLCAFAPPDFGTLLVTGDFLNPIQQPALTEIGDGGFEAVWGAFTGRACDAAIVRTSFFYTELSQQDRSLTRVIYTTYEHPNQALTAGPRVTDEQRRKITLSLTTNPTGIAATAALRAHYDKHAPRLVVAQANEYAGHNFLLEGVVFGW